MDAESSPDFKLAPGMLAIRAMRLDARVVVLGAVAAIACSSGCGRPAPVTPPPQPPAPAKATTEITSAASPREPTTGLFRYDPDAETATFQDCTSGRTFPVLTTEDYLSTQTAYTSATAGSPGVPMRIKAYVRVVQVPYVGGRERHDMIVIDRLVETSTDTSTCRAAAEQAAPPLAVTRWRLVELDGRQVAPASAEPWPTPSLVLDEQHGLVGFAGCNDIRGRWGGATEQGQLSFQDIVATRKTCSASATEADFLRALAQTRRFEVSDRTLVLFDDSGPRARFEAQRE